MVTPSRMNIFLNKMLKKSDDELSNDEGVESCASKWIRRIQSPTKFSVSPLSPTHSSSPKTKGQSAVNTGSTTPVNEEMQDLQRIRRDFETGYLSPTKANKSPTRGKFVKKMVAAFEQKSNVYREPKGSKADQKYKRNSLNAVGEFQIRRSSLNETFVIQQRCRSYERLPHSPVSAPYFADEPPFDITEYTFEIDEDLPTETYRSAEKYDQVIEDETNCQSRERTDSMIKREKAPKIVGALLKKPIEVEETQIHWIPITNQKLPRKSSFKKLLSLLTGKKIVKGSKLYCPQTKPNEEPKEFQDSGYDEKSSSSSSLSSRVSFNDVLQQQETPVVELQRNTRISTFQSLPEATADKFEEDIYFNQEYLDKKIMFEEVPRSEVRLSLGPFFPAPAKTIMSLNSKDMKKENEEIYLNCSREASQSRTPSPLPKHPFVSPLPKHPFVSENSLCREHHNSIMSIEEFSQNDLRRMPSWKFPSSEVIYDTPRNYLSTSNPDIVIRDKYGSHFNRHNDIIYDLPKVRVPARPKSSVYEDALSLKRRSADFQSSLVLRTNFYAFPDEPEQYATIKHSRNTKVLPSQQLLRSMAENDKNQLRAPYLVNCFSQPSTVF